MDNNAGASDPAASGDLVAYAGIWNIALSDAEVASLATPGTLPTDVQPGHLVAYWPLVGNASPEPDDAGSFDMTINGSLSRGGDPWANVLLTGVQGASAIGALLTSSPTLINLTGVSATGTAGTISLQALKILTGVLGSSAIGTLAKVVSPTMTGVAASSAIGALAFQVIKTLTGVAAAGAVGVITPGVLVDLLGVQGVAALGALVADTALRINLTGVQGGGAVGLMISAVEILLAANGATGDVGELAEEIAVSLVGLAAEMDIGDFTITDGWIRLGNASVSWVEVPNSSGVWTPVSGAPTTWMPQR